MPRQVPGGPRRLRLPMGPMTPAPLVTVIVPVYNGARYLRESLDSIVAQTYARLEILVMDDASTDETPAIAASYGSRVHYHRNAVNLGQFDNVNAGIALARGELIAVYHADDVYSPRIVEREVACFQRWPEIGAVFCQDIFIDAAGQEYGRLQLPPEIAGAKPLPFPIVLNALLRYENTFLVCPSAMVRARAYATVGTYRAEPWRDSADLEMWTRITRAFPIVVLDEYLMKYRHFPAQAHRRYNRLRTEPALHFAILDGVLDDGGRSLATGDALAAHEGHRAQDRLMNAVNLYIIGHLSKARSVLSGVRLATIVGTRQIQRGRMLVLFLLLLVLTRLPRLPVIAGIFEWRWQSGRTIGVRRRRSPGNLATEVGSGSWSGEWSSE